VTTIRPRSGLIGGLALTLAVTGLTAVATGSAANAAPHYESPESVKRKEKHITFEIRVPEQFEADPAHARQLNWYRGVRLTVERNAVPKIDSKAMFNGGFPCVREAPYPRLGGFASRLEAVATDADDRDESNLRAEFAIWPTDNPSARTIVTSGPGWPGRVYSVNLTAGTLVDGQTYGWQARAADGLDVSKWSKKCHFTYDGTAPSEPTVTLDNAPSGSIQVPVGQPAVFTFSGNGDTDVAGFQYAWDNLGVNTCEYSGEFGQLVCTDPLSRPGTVVADTPGGTATVSINPTGPGRQYLEVRAIDRAGNTSAKVRYQVTAPYSDPQVEVQNGTPRWGQEVVLKFTPANGVTGVRTYEVRRDHGEPETVQAETDGTGYYRFVADSEYGHEVSVRSVSDNGFVSSARNWWLHFNPWPQVASDIYFYPPSGGAVGGVGVQGSFTFSPPPGWTDTVAYRYEFRSHSSERIEVAAGADGTATMTWTPDSSGAYELTVWAVRADGSTASNRGMPYYFEVA